MASANSDFSRMMIVLAFLLFSLPTFYSQWVPGLQSLTVVVSEGLLGLAGLPVLVQEYYIAIPRGQFVITEGCSGTRYLTSNLILFFLYSLLSRYSSSQFLLGLLVTVSLALLMNWIRVVTIILFGQYFGIGHSFVQDHENYGQVLYASQLIPLFYLLLKIERLEWQQLPAYRPVTRDALTIPSMILVVPPLLLVLWNL
jgi:exosortase